MSSSLRIEQPVDTASWRADIDGLRALAILAVVGYHFFPRTVQGGFVGVDIFFVISGYLITRILLNARDAGTFSIAGFYAARVRRIFPALVLVLGTVLVASWTWLFSDERAALGREALAGAGFFSNFALWHDSGYFDAAIESKPLAHLWSLGVEEQFYLVWPLLVAVLAARGRMAVGLLLLLVASAAANVLLVDSQQHTVFYLPVFRFWELLAGAFLACTERQGRPEWLERRAQSASVIGLALLALCVILIYNGLAFPGWWAALPVVGSMLLIAAGPRTTINRILLASRPMVWLGWISYPLYLWHWPVLTFARTVFAAEPTAWGMGLLLVVSVVLAALTWWLVEKPLRTPTGGRLKVAGLVTLMGLVAVVATATYQHPGLPEAESARRAVLPDYPEQMMEKNADVIGDCRLAHPASRGLVHFCNRDSRGTERFALVGDSRAQVLFNGLVRTSVPEGRWLLIGGALSHTSVVPVLGTDPRRQDNQPGVRVALETIQRNPRIETVLIATATRMLYLLPREDTLDDLPSSPNHDAALEGLRNFTQALLRSGKKVVLLVDNPSLSAPRACLRPVRFPSLAPVVEELTLHRMLHCEVTIAHHRELSAQYRRLLTEVQQLAPDRVTIFDPLPYLCAKDSGICGMKDGEHILYSYSDHISDYAAGKIGAALNETLTGRSAAAAP